MNDHSANLRGVYCILIGLVIITLQDSTIKWLSPYYALHLVMVGRGVVALGITLLILRAEGGLHLVRTKHLGWHLIRGFMLFIANMTFFLAAATLPLAEVVAIFFVAPLLITALSVPLLGESVGPRRWVAVLLGLLGVVVMMRPAAGEFRWVTLLPVVAATAYTCMQLLSRKLGATDKASTMAFYVQITFVILSLGVGCTIGDGRFAGDTNASLEFLLRPWHIPLWQDWWLFIWCGIGSGVGGYLLGQAYRLGEPSAVAPFEYVALPLSVIWGVLFFDDWPDTTAFAGMALILGSGLYILYREKIRDRALVSERPMPRNR